jgi:glycosyltransferase involved in cell wall biosynthesis
MAAPHVHLLGLNDDLYLENALILIYYPYNFEEIKKFKNPVVIYDVLDDISIFDHVTWDAPGKTARDYYARLLQRADIVMTSSRILLDKIREARPDTLYVPNGVYPEHFNPSNFSVADELKDLNHPLVGFHGAIATWIDVQLLLQVARLRSDYQFVLVGPVSIPDEIGDLKQQKNVHFIDSVPYERIPAYIKGFDVGVMPFKLSTLTNAVRPLKVLEYLSMEKPVVATPIEELKDWPGVLLATSPEEFAARVDEALQAGGIVGDSQAVKRFLEEAAWPEVVRPLMEKLNSSSKTPA